MNKAESTRLELLNKAFELIYQQGYQATSVDKILNTTQVTKGAFYYHFKNKEEMGLAMIKEVVAPRLHRLLIAPLEKEEEDAATLIYQTIADNLLYNNDFDIRYGCPINNLVQEMSPVNQAFQKSLQQ
ncbi:MAG: TetR/AcrR family transcriptional regulator, partial [Bacteroidota bacterium]